MKPYPITANEQQRLKELYSMEILDTPADKDFNDIVHLSSQLFGVPVSLVTLLDADRQWFKASVGTHLEELDRKDTFCNYTILQDDIFEVKDLSGDECFRSYSAVLNAPGFRYYAGIPLKSNNGFNIGTLCLFDTVPRQLSAEQRLALKVLSRHAMTLMETKVKNKDLIYFTETQSKIISIIGHDIRNPLASFRVMLDLIEEQADSFTKEEADEMNSLLKTQMDSTLNLLSNLVQWGKLQMQTKNIPPQNVDLYPLVDRTLHNMNGSAVSKGNRLVNLIPKETYTEVDIQAVEFILRNLLTNANKFTENGHITVSHTLHNDRYVVSVTDTGVGMDEQQIKQVLHETGSYYTVGTREEKGSGLGLSLVREFLKKQNSALCISSKLGEGTSVSFSL